ncbi:helix-turn-helix domain-containing protein [Ancylobacter sp. MQZ15Z-1]|uniref:Helix-turn-helix domain-containing protein n=1 Tax=Ancylobacter mangrovi TaxID=2972472 RepID=A0A9X2T424_9HYPH|nr:helix-turn-helix domain-containing protein [Ancylobacter mangrovi]MCS0497782.1 helix-turn-helix domain-containing protein [Ancylobacter mangrovi]
MTSVDPKIAPPPFRRLRIERIEDLSDAVRDAHLRTIQLSAHPLFGSLAFAEEDGVGCTSGYVGGRVSLQGPLSCDGITIGLGLRLAPGCWQWLSEAETRNVAIFNEADEHDSVYGPGSLYAVVALSAERLEAEAAKYDLVLDRKTLGGTRLHSRKLAASSTERLAERFERIHSGEDSGTGVVAELLSVFIEHLSRFPIDHDRRVSRNMHARIVQKARAYIHEHLVEPIALDAIASAAGTSRRTLYRAFADILDDSPQTYVRRLRLHRIRENLASDTELACTITVIANQWGISELGRLAGWYRGLFGERPSETLSRANRTKSAQSPASLH